MPNTISLDHAQAEKILCALAKVEVAVTTAYPSYLVHPESGEFFYYGQQEWASRLREILPDAVTALRSVLDEAGVAEVGAKSWDNHSQVALLRHLYRVGFGVWLRGEMDPDASASLYSALKLLELETRDRIRTDNPIPESSGNTHDEKLDLWMDLSSLLVQNYGRTTFDLVPTINKRIKPWLCIEAVRHFLRELHDFWVRLSSRHRDSVTAGLDLPQFMRMYPSLDGGPDRNGFCPESIRELKAGILSFLDPGVPEVRVGGVTFTDPQKLLHGICEVFVREQVNLTMFVHEICKSSEPFDTGRRKRDTDYALCILPHVIQSGERCLSLMSAMGMDGAERNIGECVTIIRQFDIDRVDSVFPVGRIVSVWDGYTQAVTRSWGAENEQQRERTLDGINEAFFQVIRFVRSEARVATSNAYDLSEPQRVEIRLDGKVLGSSPLQFPLYEMRAVLSHLENAIVILEHFQQVCTLPPWIMDQDGPGMYEWRPQGTRPLDQMLGISPWSPFELLCLYILEIQESFESVWAPYNEAIHMDSRFFTVQAAPLYVKTVLSNLKAFRDFLTGDLCVLRPPPLVVSKLEADEYGKVSISRNAP